MADAPQALTRPQRRDAAELIRDSQALRRRARRRLDETAGAEVDSAIERVREAVAAGDPAAVAASSERLRSIVDARLAFVRKSRAREYFEQIGIAVLFALSLRAFVFEAFQIPTASMEPTLLVGDHLFVAKNAFGIRIPFTTRYLVRWGEIERGDVIVFRFPVEEVRTQVRIGQLTRYILGHFRSTGAFPDSLDRAVDPASGQAPPPDTRVDAWNNPFRYQEGEGSFSLRSAGPDGVFDTPDDLTNQNSAFYNGVDRCLDEASVRYGKDYIKRVIGLPGDRVRVSSNVLYVNDVAVARSEPIGQGVDAGMPYTDYRETLDNGVELTVRSFGVLTNFGEIVVRPDHVFVMGDNRDRSSDGRCWGQVPLESVKGTAMFIFFSRDRGGSGRIRWERFFDGVR